MEAGSGRVWGAGRRWEGACGTGVRGDGVRGRSRDAPGSRARISWAMTGKPCSRRGSGLRHETGREACRKLVLGDWEGSRTGPTVSCWASRARPGRTNCTSRPAKPCFWMGATSRAWSCRVRLIGLWSGLCARSGEGDQGAGQPALGWGRPDAARGCVGCEGAGVSASLRVAFGVCVRGVTPWASICARMRSTAVWRCGVRLSPSGDSGGFASSVAGEASDLLGETEEGASVPGCCGGGARGCSGARGGCRSGGWRAGFCGVGGCS